MKKIMCLALLICSFNINAFVGETHEAINGNSIRILPNTIELDKGTIFAVVESQSTSSVKLLYAFSKLDCIKGYGSLRRIGIAEGIVVPPYIVFLEGNTLNEDIVRDMCKWASQHTK